MNYTDPKVTEVANKLKNQLSSLANKRDILKAPELKQLLDDIKNKPDVEKASYGNQVNQLKNELSSLANENISNVNNNMPIDITAPFDINMSIKTIDKYPSATLGSIHPLSKELKIILDIFSNMGFSVIESRQIDDDFHMFGSLNFPEGHPARDDYDTFITTQTDKNNTPLIAPAHTSTMQNRILSDGKKQLLEGNAVASVIPGRVFRNEDVDTRHDHTFNQIEGIYVDKGVNTGNLIATLKSFLEAYFTKSIEVKTSPFYFPFTEPSFEFSLSCPFCDKSGCQICSFSGWIELLGCGMIHPEVLKQAQIDPETYTGFAWGMGLERLVMMKNNIEDMRLFASGRLEFLRQFS